MIGSRVYTIIGSFVGSAVGSSADDEGLTDPFAGVTVDAGLGWRLPSTAAEWTTFNAAIGGTWNNPNHLWLLQEPSGNPSDTIGTGLGTRNLTATTGPAAPLYQQTIAPATRKFIAGNGSAVSCNLSNSSMVDTATSSFAILAVLTSETATVLRNLIIYGLPQTSQPASAKWRLRLGASLVDTTGDHSNVIQLCFIVYNLSLSSVKFYTPTEKLSVTFGASVGTGLSFQLSSTGDTTKAACGYAAGWDDTDAEFSDTEAKNLMEGLLQTTVPWS